MRKPRRRSTILVLGLAGLATLGFAVPEFLASRTAETRTICDGPSQDNHVCRFIGAPLEMAGTPVFVEKFNHAFLPTTKQIEFLDGFGHRWTAPAKTLTDGASIPQMFEPLVGDRQSREYLLAAVMHDAYCGVGNEHLETYHTRPWEEVHRMFYEALLVSGTSPLKAKIMFAAVYLGGPRWSDPERSLEEVPAEMLRQELLWCLRWIEAANPSPEKIISWMKDREIALKSGQATIPDYLLERGI